jgi:aryl-alcohol dehydrogenase-like predicted oxidoreductase
VSLIGTTSTAQMREDLAMLEFELSTAERRAMDNLLH